MILAQSYNSFPSWYNCLPSMQCSWAPAPDQEDRGSDQDRGQDRGQEWGQEWGQVPFNPNNQVCRC